MPPPAADCHAASRAAADAAAASRFTLLVCLCHADYFRAFRHADFHAAAIIAAAVYRLPALPLLYTAVRRCRAMPLPLTLIRFFRHADGKRPRLRCHYMP